MEIKGKSATIAVPGKALKGRKSSSGAGHFLATPFGDKVEAGAVSVPLRSLRKKPLATWGDDFLSLEGSNVPDRATLMKWFYGDNPEAFASAAEDSGEVDGSGFFASLRRSAGAYS